MTLITAALSSALHDTPSHSPRPTSSGNHLVKWLRASIKSVVAESLAGSNPERGNRFYGFFPRAANL